VTPYMLVLESMVIFYLCSDVVHIGIGVYVDILAVTPYMLVVEFGGKCDVEERCQATVESVDVSL
jgi:hypothetical protein